jgi:hypothetical protein
MHVNIGLGSLEALAASTVREGSILERTGETAKFMER